MYETKLITSGQYKSALEGTVVLNRQKTEQTYDDPSTYAIYCATVQIMKKMGSILDILWVLKEIQKI